MPGVPLRNTGFLRPVAADNACMVRRASLLPCLARFRSCCKSPSSGGSVPPLAMAGLVPWQASNTFGCLPVRYMAGCQGKRIATPRPPSQSKIKDFCQLSHRESQAAVIGGFCAVFWGLLFGRFRRSSSVSPIGEPPSPRGKGLRPVAADNFESGTPASVQHLWVSPGSVHGWMSRETDCHSRSTPSQ